MHEIIKWAEKNDQECIILSLDFLKCFDRIEFKAITGAMSFFGFVDYLIEWTSILYNGFQVNTQNNGHFSNRIPVNRGLHQGGPCWSLYFLIVAEIMAILPQDHPEIKGLMINDIK